MFTSVLTHSRRLGFIALLVATIAPQALAQAGARHPVENCIASIAHITARTAQINRQIANRTIDIIEALDANGAPDEAIIIAGREGKAAINHRGQRAVHRINTIVDRCVAFLTDHDAPQGAIDAVIQAGQAGRDAVGASVHHSKVRINRAVAIAIEG